MARRTAIQIADTIRRVEYAIAESESNDGLGNTFMQSPELADFWVAVDALDAIVATVATKYDATATKKWRDVKTDRDKS